MRNVAPFDDIAARRLLQAERDLARAARSLARAEQATATAIRTAEQAEAWKHLAADRAQAELLRERARAEELRQQLLDAYASKPMRLAARLGLIEMQPRIPDLPPLPDFRDPKSVARHDDGKLSPREQAILQRLRGGSPS